MKMTTLFKRIAWLEPFWVLAMAPFLLLPDRFIPETLVGTTTTLQPFALAVLGLGWPVRRLAYGRFTRLTPITFPILLILVWLPVNYWAAVDKKLALDALGYLLLGIALYFAFINWPPTQNRPERLAWFMVIMGFGLALAAPFLSNLAMDSLFQIPRAAPILKRLAALTPGNVNENRMAGTLVILWPLFVALFLHRQQPVWWRLFNGLAAAIIFLLLLFSQSRGALLAGLIGLALLLVLRWPRLAYFLLPLFIGAAFFGYQMGDGLFLEVQSADNPVGGWNGRLEIWSRALYALADFPFTGVGMGNFSRVIPILYPYFTISPSIVVEHSHNIFTQIAIDLGLPGLIAYLAIHGTTFYLLAGILKTRASNTHWYLAAGVLAGLVIMFVHGLVDAAVWGAKPAFVAWLLLALAVLLSLHQPPSSQ